MQNQATGRRFGGWGPRLKRREAPTASPQSNQSLQSSRAATDEYNDGQLARNRYNEAARRLKDAIKIRKGPWNSLDFEQLSCEPEDFDELQFKNKINAVFKSWETSIKDRTGWVKLTYAVECVFTAFSPFAKNFLTVAANAQSVIPFIPFLGSNH